MLSNETPASATTQDNDIDEPAAKIVPAPTGNRAVIVVDGETISIPVKNWAHIKSEISDAIDNARFDSITNESDAEKERRIARAKAVYDEMKEYDVVEWDYFRHPSYDASSLLDSTKPFPYISSVNVEHATPKTTLDIMSAKQFSKLCYQMPAFDFNPSEIIKEAMDKAYVYVGTFYFKDHTSVNHMIELVRAHKAFGREVVLVVNKASSDNPKIIYDKPANGNNTPTASGARVLLAEGKPLDIYADPKRINLDDNMPHDTFSVRVLHQPAHRSAGKLAIMSRAQSEKYYRIIHYNFDDVVSVNNIIEGIKGSSASGSRIELVVNHACSHHHKITYDNVDSRAGCEILTVLGSLVIIDPSMGHHKFSIRVLRDNTAT